MADVFPGDYEIIKRVGIFCTSSSNYNYEVCSPKANLAGALFYDGDIRHDVIGRWELKMTVMYLEIIWSIRACT